MKKGIQVFLIVFILFTVSCSGQEPVKQNKKEISQQKQQEQTEHTVSVKELKTIDLEQDAISVSGYLEQGIVNSIIYFGKDKLVYFVEEQSKDSVDTLTYQIYLYDNNKKENIHLIDVENVSCSMGDICLLKNKLYYAFGHVKDIREYNTLLEVDLKNASARLISIENATVPLVNLAVTDQDLYILKRNEVSNERSDYIVEKVNGEKFVPVMETSYEGDQGEVITAISGEKEFFYVYGRKNNSDQTYLMCLTADGEFVNQYSYDVTEFLKLDMEDGEEKEDTEPELDTLWNMVKKENYFILNTINHRNLVLKENEGQLVSVPVPEQLNSPDLTYGTNPIINLGDGKYLFFIEIFENEIYILDTKTGEYAKCKINVDGEIYDVCQNGENYFMFKVRRKNGTEDYLLYEQTNGWDL